VTDGAVQPVTGYTRASYLEAGARELPKLDGGALVDEIAAKLRAGAGSDVTGMHFLGVLKQDEAGLYLGIAVGKVSVGDQTASAGAIGVVGLTLVKEIPVSLGLYQANVGAEAVPDLLAKVQQTLASMLQANAETEAREGATRRAWHGISLDPVLVCAAIGGAIGAVIGVAAVARSRRRKHRTGPPA
jgi:hypothetical protein